MTVGQYIETERVNRGLTQTEFGELIGVKNRAVCMMEKDKVAIKKPRREAIMKVLGCDEDVLINGNDVPYKDPLRLDNGMMKSSYRKNNKYQASHYEYYKMRFGIGEREKYQQIAIEQGYESFQKWIKDAIREKAGE